MKSYFYLSIMIIGLTIISGCSSTRAPITESSSWINQYGFTTTIQKPLTLNDQSCGITTQHDNKIIKAGAVWLDGQTGDCVCGVIVYTKGYAANSIIGKNDEVRSITTGSNYDLLIAGPKQYCQSVINSTTAL